MIAFLTGAGLSKSFGGLLAKDLSSFLIGNPRISRKVRGELVTTNNFETVLGKYEKHGGPEYERLIEAMLDGFQSHEIMLSAKNVSSGMFTNFLSWVWAENGDDRTYYFTLNQDLLIERMRNVDHAPGSPGTRRGKKKARTFVSGEPIMVEELVGGINWEATEDINAIRMLKLHGSTHFEQTMADGTTQVAILAGDRKEDKMKEFPTILEYFDQFERVMTGKPVDLIVIGYSFGDDHINEVLVDASEAGMRLHIIDLTPPNEWADFCIEKSVMKIGPRLGKLVERVRSYFPVPFDTIFEPATGTSNEWLSHLRKAITSEH